MGVFMALRLSAVLHCAQLRFASLGALVHGYFCGLNTLDCRLLLPHGVDGKFTRISALQCLFMILVPVIYTKLELSIAVAYSLTHVTNFPVTGHHYQFYIGHSRCCHGYYIFSSRHECPRLHG